MPRNLSNKALQEIFSQNSSDPFLFLITFTHPNYLGQFFRFVNDLQNLTSRGNVFSAMAVKLTLPIEDGNSIPTITLEMDNVPLTIMTELRAQTAPFSVNIELVLASQPDILEMELSDMLLTKLNYSAEKLTGTLISDNLFAQKIPGSIYSPQHFPGLFK